jgi:hypothetical protein
MALSLGMNREIPPGTLASKEIDHRRGLWWTVYIIDRKMSINMGAPLSVEDKDIDVSLPSSVNSQHPALSLHAQLATLEGKVMKGMF